MVPTNSTQAGVWTGKGKGKVEAEFLHSPRSCKQAWGKDEQALALVFLFFFSYCINV
jgi:hypothetical protein